MKAQIDSSGDENGGTRLASAAGSLTAIAREDARILAELARAVEDDLARPDLAASTERAHAHDRADFATFCRRHGLKALPAAPQTLALYLKSLETKKSQSPAGLQAGTAGLSVSTLRRRLAAIASKHATEKLETPTGHPLVEGRREARAVRLSLPRLPRVREYQDRNLLFAPATCRSDVEELALHRLARGNRCSSVGSSP